MKRKIYLLCMVLLLQMPVFSQSVIWEETFDSSPVGWTLQDNWAINNGKLAMNWSPVIVNYDLSAVSPNIVLPENAGDLIVKQYLNIYIASVSTEQAQISVLHGEDEFVLWTYNCVQGDWGVEGGKDTALSISQFANQTIKLKFRSWGPTTDAWYDWNIYNLQITGLFDDDLAAYSIDGPYNIEVNENATWQVEVKNVGMNTQNNFGVVLRNVKTSEIIDSIAVNQSLTQGQSTQVEFAWTPEYPQNTNFVAQVYAENDEFQGNDISQPYFVRVEPDFDYQVLVFDRDNDITTIENPENGTLEQAEQGLIRALSNAGIQYDLVNQLPLNIYDYDIVIGTMGCFCLN